MDCVVLILNIIAFTSFHQLSKSIKSWSFKARETDHAFKPLFSIQMHTIKHCAKMQTPFVFNKMHIQCVYILARCGRAFECNSVLWYTTRAPDWNCKSGEVNTYSQHSTAAVCVSHPIVAMFFVNIVLCFQWMTDLM